VQHILSAIGSSWLSDLCADNLSLLSQPYLKKAENDKKRYQEEMQNYEPDAEADE
jgi:hypothetical protein